MSASQQDSALVGAYKKDRPRKPPVCWNCDEVGHIQRYCPKGKNSRSQHKAKTAEEKSSDSDGEGAFAASGDLPEMGSLVGKLYQLDCEPAPVEDVSVVCERRNDVDLWHQRLGHLNGQRLSDIAQNELATGIKLPKAMKLSFCEGCVEGKMHRKPFKSVGDIRSTRKLQLVHSDVCGPMQIIL